MTQRPHDPRRFVCIHGHFYQPPRENAWLERVEVQDSAHPYHDWNERIDAECYGPNATSRILDEQDRITRIVNNYASISFNFGPTLLSWLELHSPATYSAILEADRISRAKFSGHGSAMAQVYSHAILPLCNARDKRTQVRWGIRDFERRFGRRPEGLWLSETAVDLDSLEVLAAEGIRFTVLSPTQASEVRANVDAAWRDVSDGSIDTHRAWRLRLASGREIALFFYDGSTSQAVAFERLLSRGDRFAHRLMSGFDDDGPPGQLVHIATDGETYGHHHAFGDMALAWAVDAIDRDDNVRLTNYGEFLELFPPEGEVRIRENTAWSCSHLLGRWSSDCGCSTGAHPGWNQSWRAGLRRALDRLRDNLAEPWEQAAGRRFADPWAARDAYIDVALHRETEVIDRFLADHASASLEPSERVEALCLMELQRHAMLMYTSCGWFFDDLSGIETRQILQYAGRAIQLAEEWLPGFSGKAFLELLAEARSNDPACGDGRAIYESTLEAAEADLARVAVNHAARALFGEPDRAPRTPGYAIEPSGLRNFRNGDSRAVAGQMKIRSRVTEREAHLAFALFHSTTHEVLASVGPGVAADTFAEWLDDLERLFDAGNASSAAERILERIAGRAFAFNDLFRDEQRSVMHHILESTLHDVEGVYRGLHERHAGLLRRLAGIGTRQPRALRLASELVLNTEIAREFSNPDLDPLRLERLLTEAKDEGVRLDAANLAYRARSGLRRMIDAFADAPDDRGRLRLLAETARIVRGLPFHVDVRETENRCYALSRTIYAKRARRASNDGGHEAEWTNLFRDLAETLRIAIDTPDSS